MQRRQFWRHTSNVLVVAIGASAAEMIAELADIISDPVDGKTDGSWFRFAVVSIFTGLFVLGLSRSSQRVTRAAEIVFAVEIARPGWDNRYTQALRRLERDYRKIPLPIRLETEYDTSAAAGATIVASVDNMLSTIADHWPDHGLLVFVNARPHDAYLVGSRLTGVTSRGAITLLQPDQDGGAPFDERMELAGRYVPYTVDASVWSDVVDAPTPEPTDGTPGVLDVVLYGTITADSMPDDVEAFARAHGQHGADRIVMRVDYDQLKARNLAAELPLFVRERVTTYIRSAPHERPIHTVQLYTAAPGYLVVALGYYQFPALGVTTYHMAARPTGELSRPMHYQRSVTP
ncbi:MAG: hypothetical protein ACR2G2_07035 [Pseudonocardia sp.]